MAERQTLLSRNLGPAPTTQGAQQGAPAGAFGDARGLINLGQGIQQAAGVVNNIATNRAAAETRAREKEANDLLVASKEHEKRQGADYQMRYQADLEATVRGVKEQHNRDVGDGMFASGGAYSALEDRLRSARSSLKERYRDVSADRIFRDAVPESKQNLDWEKNTGSMLESAAGLEGLANLDGRRRAAATILSTAFQDVKPGAHGAVHDELVQKYGMLHKAALPDEEKAKLKKELGESAYYRLAMGATNGYVVPDSIMLSPLFTVQQQKSIQDLNKAIKSPKAFPSNEVARQEIQSATADPAFASNPQAIARIQAATDFIAESQPTPELKREVYASVDLKAKEYELAANLYTGLDNPKGLPLYEHLVTLNSRINNKDEVEAVYNSLGIKGADPKEKSAFMTRITTQVAEDLAKMSSNRSNEVLVRHAALAPIASAVTAEFNSGKLTPQSAATFVAVSKQLATAAGLPEHLQHHYPPAVKSILMERARTGDSDTVQNLTDTFIQGFGVSSLHGLADSFFRVDQKATGATSANVTEAAYGMLFKMVAWDHTRVLTGDSLNVPQKPNSKAMFKPLLDGLKKYEELEGTLFKGAAGVAEKAYDKVRFKDRASINDMVTRHVFFDKDGDFNRPANIEKALAYQHGGNSVAALAFRQLFTRNLLVKVFGPGAATTSEDDEYRNGAAGKAAQELNNQFAGIFTVYDASGGLSSEPTYDIMPSVFRSEGSFDYPLLAGAANQEDQSEQLTASLKVISYYGPRREWDRGSVANAFTNLASARNDFFFPLVDTGRGQVPTHLQIPWERAVISKSQEKATSTTGTGSEIADFIWRKNSMPVNKATAASVLFAQEGSWMYDPKRMGFRLMLRPGMIATGAAGATRAQGAPQPMLFNYSDDPKKSLMREYLIPDNLVREYDQSRRAVKADGLTKEELARLDARRAAQPANEPLPTGP